MSGHPRRRRPPLPMRDGLEPSRIRLPRAAGDGAGTAARTIAAHLAARFPRDAPLLAGKIAAGEVVDSSRAPISEDTPFTPGADVYLYRDPPAETPVPFELDVLHHDENLLVVDKPHFLATMPRGSHVTETVLVRLRRATGNDALAPAHRLDRLTAGVLVLTTHPGARRSYQELFASRAVRKTYEAVSTTKPRVGLPTVVRSRIVKEPGTHRVRETAGEPNAVSVVEAAPGSPYRVRVRPRSGKTHQIRVHLASVGAPVVNDPLYGPIGVDGGSSDPEPSTAGVCGAHGESEVPGASGGPESSDDPSGDPFGSPLQLLARSVAFTDPLTGADRRFVSARRLASW